MICALGLWPRANAGKATAACKDFRDRGGTLMIRRLISPRRQAPNLLAISSLCQVGMNWTDGLSSRNERCTNVEKSFLRIARYSASLKLFIPAILSLLGLRNFVGLPGFIIV